MIKTLLQKLVMQTSPAPRPFPGKHPTRIWIHSYDNNVPFDYFGKLSPAVAESFRHRFLLKDGKVDHVRYYEFDQNGIIFSANKGYRDTWVNFAEMYIPMQRNIINDLILGNVFYYLLHRTPAHIEKRQTTVVEFFKGTKWEKAEQQMVTDCARGRLGRNWFGEDIDEVIDALQNQADKWIGRQPKVVVKRPKTKEEIALALERAFPRANVPAAIHQAVAPAIPFDPVDYAVRNQHARDQQVQFNQAMNGLQFAAQAANFADAQPGVIQPVEARLFGEPARDVPAQPPRGWDEPWDEPEIVNEDPNF